MILYFMGIIYVLASDGKIVGDCINAKDDCGNNGMSFRQSTCVPLISPGSLSDNLFRKLEILK